jgi:CHAT domain-containing protein
VISFAPRYSISNNSFPELKGASSEAYSVSGAFKGIVYKDKEASETKLKSTFPENVILHLAMHSSTDTLDSKYSYLVFDSSGDSINDGRLYSYEISMSKIKSTLIVLSSCNTGVGSLYHGEGIMSIARSFFLAGATSLVNTLWDVNDEASSSIVSDFYLNISRGMDRDKAMQLAKLNYLKNSPPTYSNPYFWAAYQVIGDKSTIKHSKNTYIWIISLTSLLIGLFLAMKYFLRKPF